MDDTGEFVGLGCERTIGLKARGGGGGGEIEFIKLLTDRSRDRIGIKKARFRHRDSKPFPALVTASTSISQRESNKEVRDKIKRGNVIDSIRIKVGLLI